MLSRKFLRIQVHKCLRATRSKNDPDDFAAPETMARDGHS